MEERTHSGEQLKSVARQWVGSLAPRAGATMATLSGELGAGKTTFVQGIAEALGVRETVASPTFVIEKMYDLSGQRWRRLIHIDAYRLKSAQELEALGWKELVADPHNLILLEWPERVPDLIPEESIRVRFEIAGDGRIITIDGKENGNKID